MTGSAIRNIRTLTQNPSRTAGNDAFAWCQLKNVSCTRGQPGEETTRTPSRPSATTVTAVAVSPRCRRIRRATLSRSSWRALGDQSLTSARVRRPRPRARSAGSCSRVPSDSSVPRASLTQGSSLLPFSISRPNSSGAPVASNCPVIVPCGISTAVMIERRGQVGDDRVHLAVEQRLFGDVGVLEHQRLLRRLDVLADCGEARGAGLGTELELFEVGQRRSLVGLAFRVITAWAAV